MKRLILLVIITLSQTTTFASGVSTPNKTPMDKLNLRIRQQVAQIQRETKLGKLTKDQAKTLRTQVEAIRQQEIADLKQNGTKTLTDAQVSQLNDQLNTLSKSILVK